MLPHSMPHRAARACSRFPAATRPKALTHATAKWPWLSRGRDARSTPTATSCGSRSAPSPRRPPPRRSTSPERPRSRSREASALLGVALDPSPGRGQRRRSLRADAARARRSGSAMPPTRVRAKLAEVRRHRGRRRVAQRHRARPGRARCAGTSRDAPSFRALRVAARPRRDRRASNRPEPPLSREDAGIGIRVYPGTRPTAQRA